MLSLLTLAEAGVIAGLLVAMLRSDSPRRASEFAGGIVIVSSLYTLLTASPGSTTFRFHVVLLLAMLAIEAYGWMRGRA